MIMIGLKIP